MNCTGFIRQQGSQWYYVIELGRDTEGKRRQMKKRGFRTEQEADAALTKALLLASEGHTEYFTVS